MSRCWSCWRQAEFQWSPGQAPARSNTLNKHEVCRQIDRFKIIVYSINLPNTSWCVICFCVISLINSENLITAAQHMPHTEGVTGSLTATRLENKMFPVTKGRDISGGDEVTTVPKVDSVLSVNGWQYPNRLAQFTRLLSYQHCRLNVNLDTIVSTARNWLMHVFEIKLICLFKKQCWNRVEVEFTGTTNSKCFAPFNKTYLKFFIWAKTDFFSHSCRALHPTTNACLFSHFRAVRSCVFTLL